MDANKFIIRVGALAGATGALILAAMIGVGASAGAELAKMQSLAPATVNQSLAAIAPTIQTLMTLDDLFVVAYVVTFIGIAAYARERAGMLAVIALVFALTTGALDFFENSITLALVAVAQAGQTLDASTLFAFNIVTQMKYLCTNVAVGLFGLGLWNTRGGLDRVASILLLAFLPINVLAFVNPVFSAVRIFAMVFLLAVGAIVLWTRK